MGVLRLSLCGILKNIIKIKGNLIGTISNGANNKEYNVLAGYEKQETVFVEKYNQNGLYIFVAKQELKMADFTVRIK